MDAVAGSHYHAIMDVQRRLLAITGVLQDSPRICSVFDISLLVY